MRIQTRISNYVNEFVSGQSAPIYALGLFVIVFAVLFYIIVVWVFGEYVAITEMHYPSNEGFENPQYTYLPINRSPNLSMKFGLSDLAVDISSACGFIKIDSKLNAGMDSSSPSPSQTPISTTPTTTTTMNPATYSTVKSEPFSTSEGGATPSPSPSATETSTTETSTTAPSVTTQVETQPPIPTSAAVKSNSNGDYTVPYTQLQIYKLYNTATGYSSTSNDNIYKMMDMLYGRFFDTEQLGKLTEENVEKLWNVNASIIIDDTIYNGSNFFVIQSGLNNRKCASSGKEWTGLSSYFLRQIQKNKSSASVLLSLKQAYYAIIKPRFLLNTLSNVYWQNVKNLTNSDKGTQDSIVFVLNTFASLSQINTLKQDLSADGVAKIVSDDTPFTMDSLWLYQMMSVSFELSRYVAYFKEYGSATTSSGNPAITTTASTFISGYPLYLQKINQVAPESPLVFLLKNPPNKSDCPIVDKLMPYWNNLSG